MKKIIRATTIPESLEAFCKGMLKELSRSYEVIALSSPGEVLDRVGRQEEVRVIAIPMARQISVSHDLISLWKMWRAFRKEKPDMVHSMTPKAGLICMVAARMARVPIRVHTFTGLVFPTSRGLKRGVLMLTDRLTCACATHIIPEGEGVKKDLLQYKITDKPLQVLGFGNIRGVDMDYYDHTPEVIAKAKKIKDPAKFSFLFVGRIVKDKGINELVLAFEHLYHEFPMSKLILVGSYEDSLDPISEQVREIITLYKNIQVVGRKTGTDLLAYYAASDCFVFPSYREGFPNSVLEAGAMGLPSIVTDINGSREIIVNGFNGIVIPPRDSNALYNAMKSMIVDPQKREEMASVCRSNISKHYEQSFVRQCLYNYYKSIL